MRLIVIYIFIIIRLTALFLVHFSKAVHSLPWGYCRGHLNLFTVWCYLFPKSPRCRTSLSVSHNNIKFGAVFFKIALHVRVRLQVWTVSGRWSVSGLRTSSVDHTETYRDGRQVLFVALCWQHATQRWVIRSRRAEVELLCKQKPDPETQIWSFRSCPNTAGGFSTSLHSSGKSRSVCKTKDGSGHVLYRQLATLPGCSLITHSPYSLDADLGRATL